MMKLNSIRRCFLLALATVLLAAPFAEAQVELGGDFMMRLYSEDFDGTMDDRDGLEYMRYLGRLYLDAPVSRNASFHTDFVTISTNPVFASRTLAGTGQITYGISQIYGEYIRPSVLGADLARIRFGRQQYELGQGLTMGDSYYMVDPYDGIRTDFTRGRWSFGLFGAITDQELSAGGYYPRPGSDQMYVAKLECEVDSHVLLAYSVNDHRRGDFNDNIITGIGSKGSIVKREVQYFAEMATQRFHTADGLPEKGGMAYMAGISYRWSMGPFRSIKVEMRGAGYQGDDADTDKIETFEPYYPSWFWGDRTAYVNGSVGGDYPHRGIQLEGSRIWYWRAYVSPKALPKARFQVQYAKVDDWVNNDDIVEPDDEFGFKVYYQVSDNVRVAGRYMKRIANDEDADVNNSGSITRIEDRYDAHRFMFEFRLQF